MDAQTVPRHHHVLAGLAVALVAIGALAAPGLASAQTSTPWPTTMPLPAGWGPPDIGITLIEDSGYIGYDGDYPCNEALFANPIIHETDGFLAVYLVVPLDHRAGPMRIRFGLRYLTADWPAQAIIQPIQIAMRPLYGTGYDTVEFYPTTYEEIGYGWVYVDTVLDPPAGPSGNYDVEVMIISQMTELGPYMVPIGLAGLYVAPQEDGFPDGMCVYVLPTRTPVPTMTGTVTPSATPRATTGPTTTPPTSIPLATYTPAATWTSFPTPTSIPVTPQYATPAGGWIMPTIPTPVQLNTVAPLPGFTPDATHDARVNAVATSISFGSAMQTRVYTYTELAMTWTDPTSNTTGLGSMRTIVMTITEYIATPVNWIKSLEDYLPNLWPLILTVLLGLLWIVMVLLFKFGLAVLRVAISLIVRIIDLIGQYVPTGG